MTAPSLTFEQQQISDHNHGHALVFAVAGAGKTTTMISRIERLVRERIYPADRILATTYGKAARDSIDKKLKDYPHCAPVKISTFHSLGMAVIKLAERMGLSRWHVKTGHEANAIFYQARTALIDQNPEIRDEVFNISLEDFSTYLNIQKGNLLYADYGKVAQQFPPWARTVAGQATDEPKLFLELYRMYERIRIEDGALTFDDMVTTAWELLVQHTSLLETVAGKYQCAIVDEFQDINHAQSELLHLVTRQCSSYMAIGDDDQTIYQWRGAHPKYILGFAERYGAKTYHIPHNFRSPLGVTSLANAVIVQNQVRQPKRLGLTQGLTHATHFHRLGHGEHASTFSVIQDALKRGVPKRDIAILIRYYGQTAPIEAALLEHDVPYVVVGGDSFYNRPEIKVILRYLNLARLESVRLDRPLNVVEQREYKQDWLAVFNVPTRYMRTADAERLAVRTRRESLITLLHEAAQHEPKQNTTLRLSRLADGLELLLDAGHDVDGSEVLETFCSLIGYEEHLSKSSGLPEVGRQKIDSVRSLYTLSRTRSVFQLLNYIDFLKQKQLKEKLDDAEDVVKFMTVFKAKGLEWPFVVIPDCDAEVYKPELHEDDPASTEECRRIFYVALTRSQHELHLTFEPKFDAMSNEIPVTPFLTEAKFDEVLAGSQHLALASRQPAHQDGARATFRTLQSIGQFALKDYLERWHADKDWYAGLHQRVQDLGQALNLQPTAKDGKHLVATTEWLSSFAVPSGSVPGRGPSFEDLDQLLQEQYIDQLSGKETLFAAAELRVGQSVIHARYGQGVVVKNSQGRFKEITVDFGGALKVLQTEGLKLRVISEDGTGGGQQIRPSARGFNSSYRLPTGRVSIIDRVNAADFTLEADGGRFRIEDVLALNPLLDKPLLGAVRFHLGGRFFEAMKEMLRRLAPKAGEEHQALKASAVIAMVEAEIKDQLSQTKDQDLTVYDEVNHEWLPF